MDFSVESPVSVGLTERFIAYVIDSVMIAILSTVLFWPLSSNITYEGFYVVLFDYLFFLLFSFIYYLLLPLIWKGHTVGKRIMGIRIADVSEEELIMNQIVIRAAFHGALYLVILPLVIWSISSIVNREDKRALHDLASATYVEYSHKK
ncbi:RDD family protein [Ornithinibacillus scapharcae]|uniref:RDD family protein n=1 Tax=Ornithinibacillus scapharcae TaxID=1147159 RepID=UPI000225BCA2|nr:RDD family protein [Ornithinibacillus scapharcae]